MNKNHSLYYPPSETQKSCAASVNPGRNDSPQLSISVYPWRREVEVKTPTQFLS